MPNSNSEQMRFPAVDGLTVGGDFSGGALSSNVGPLLLRGVDRQIGLTERLAAAFDDGRYPSCIQHGPRDLLAQRFFGEGVSPILEQRETR